MDSQVSLHGIDNIDDYIDKFAPEEDNSPKLTLITSVTLPRL